MTPLLGDHATTSGRHGEPDAFDDANSVVHLHGVLGIAPSRAGQQPGMIVEEREQVGLVDLNSDAVQRIPGSLVVGVARNRTRLFPGKTYCEMPFPIIAQESNMLL